MYKSDSVTVNNKCCKNYLCSSLLFKGVDCPFFEEFCKRTRIKLYEKGEIIAHEGMPCSSIGIILQGSVSMQKISSSGEFATIALFKKGDFFCEDIIYSSQNEYKGTYEAMSKSAVAFIGKDILNQLMNESPIVKDNFLRILSDKVNWQNRRIELLSQKTIREKIAYYLMDLYNEQNVAGQTDEDTINNCYSCKVNNCPTKSEPIKKTVVLPASKEIIAKYLAMPRPSFSRELSAMQKDGLIKVKDSVIVLCDVARLEMEIVEGLGKMS